LCDGIPAVHPRRFQMKITELCEILMLVSFGFSWPFNAIKSYKARTTKGKSLPFLILILFGYVCGIISKLTAPSFKWYVMFFYILNFCMVFVDFLLYFRNLKLDKRAGLIK
jgi:hypothetical protein